MAQPVDDTGSSGGRFVRKESSFRDWVVANAGVSNSSRARFVAEPGRYHLYVSLACPWAHRTLIMRNLKGLQSSISLSVVNWLMLEQGWTFESGPDVIADPQLGARYLREIYTAAIPAYTGSVTVPVLRVRVHRTIVNNESSEIIRMFNSAFDGVGAAPGDNYPSAYRGEIDALNAQINDTLLAIAEEIVAADQHTLDLVRSAHEVGAAPNTDVLQTAAQLDHDRALLPPYRQQLQVSEDVLAILVGRSPTDWSAPKFELSEFTLPANLPNTMPSVLARRRSDILAAEARLHTASAHIGVAEADLYPNLDLSAAVSRQGLLGGPSETAWSLIGGVAAPIFNGGRLIAAKRAAEANYKASFALYQDVVITALGQVADALNALANDADALAAQKDAFVSAKRSLALDQEGYKAGSADLTRVLDAQRLLDQSEDGVTRAESARLDDTVKLFFALGIGPPPDLDGARPTGRR